ncbi:hypothetical protein E4U55_003593 [Claviceps digitariae]|nr:hypothetical protein E4U55_003593 [Claviceps digitariae]
MHHHQRKSGHGHHGSSSTDLRRSTTSSDLSSKSKKSSSSKRHTSSSGSQKSSRSHHERDREREYETYLDEPESFPQYCMTCEKQFMSLDDRDVYCSMACREIDRNSTPHALAMETYSIGVDHSYHSAEYTEPRDIIPRATPSRPIPPRYTQSPSTSSTPHYSSAVSALRALAITPSSPPSSNTNSSVGFWPFSRSGSSESHRRPSVPHMSSTYDTSYDTSYQYNTGTYTSDTGSSGLDRSLPIRHPAANSRRKSTDLVTPVLGR